MTEQREYVEKCRRMGCLFEKKDHCEHYPWREIEPKDLKLPPDTPILINGRPARLGDYTSLRLPGNYSFLLGMTAFWEIRVPVEPDKEPAS